MPSARLTKELAISILNERGRQLKGASVRPGIGRTEAGMQKRAFSTCRTYNAALSACAAAGKVELALILMEEMQARSVLSPGHLNPLQLQLVGLCSAGVGDHSYLDDI